MLQAFTAGLSNLAGRLLRGASPGEPAHYGRGVDSAQGRRRLQKRPTPSKPAPLFSARRPPGLHGLHRWSAGLG